MDIKTIIGSIVRHGLSALGAILVAKGYVAPGEVGSLVELVSGAVLGVGTVVYSYYRTKKLGA